LSDHGEDEKYPDDDDHPEGESGMAKMLSGSSEVSPITVTAPRATTPTSAVTPPITASSLAIELTLSP
jgi:hypothetical protein